MEHSVFLYRVALFIQVTPDAKYDPAPFAEVGARQQALVEAAQAVQAMKDTSIVQLVDQYPDPSDREQAALTLITKMELAQIQSRDADQEALAAIHAWKCYKDCDAPIVFEYITFQSGCCDFDCYVFGGNEAMFGRQAVKALLADAALLDVDAVGVELRGPPSGIRPYGDLIKRGFQPTGYAIKTGGDWTVEMGLFDFGE